MVLHIAMKGQWDTHDDQWPIPIGQGPMTLFFVTRTLEVNALDCQPRGFIAYGLTEDIVSTHN